MYLMSKRKWLDINTTNGLPQRIIDGSSGESDLTKISSSRNRAFEACFMTYSILPPFTHLGHVAEIFKPLGVSFGGKSLVKVVTLFLTPPFRLNS